MRESSFLSEKLREIRGEEEREILLKEDEVHWKGVFLTRRKDEEKESDTSETKVMR